MTIPGEMVTVVVAGKDMTGEGGEEEVMESKLLEAMDQGSR